MIKHVFYTWAAFLVALAVIVASPVSAQQESKLIEVTCPHCKETRTTRRKNQYDTSAEKACRPCALIEAKKYFGTDMSRTK